MKAPDKIYLERDKETNKIHHLWGRDAVISSFYEHIEYIRKEALLEWANKDLCPTAYLQLKNKLEEM